MFNFKKRVKAARMRDADTGVRLFAEVIEERCITDLELGVIVAVLEKAENLRVDGNHLSGKLHGLRGVLRGARELGLEL